MPELWSVLRNEDGQYSIVVPEGTTPATALIEMLGIEYGWGDTPPSEDHPDIVAAVEGLKLERWRQYSPEAAEREGVDLDDYLCWYGPGGDEGEWFWVLNYQGNLWDLGDSIMVEPEAGISAPGVVAVDFPPTVISPEEMVQWSVITPEEMAQWDAEDARWHAIEMRDGDE